MVKEYQHDGRLPPTSVEELVHTIEGKFPQLKQAFTAAGANSVTALNQALKGQNTLTGVETLVNQWRNVLPELPHIMGLNLTNAEHTFAQVNSKLLSLAHTGPEAQRAAVSEIYKKVRDQEIAYFSEMRGGIEGEIKHLSSRMKTEGPAVVAPLETAFQRLVAVVRGEMAAAGGETQKGAQTINKILTKELSALGIKAPSKLNQAFGPLPGGGGNALQPTNTGGSSGFTGLEGAAQGRLIQLGRPGEGGRDNIPLNVGAHNIVAGAGETVAVFTRHQRAQAEAQLPGGLPGIFANKRPNYMAAGGFAGYAPSITRRQLARPSTRSVPARSSARESLASARTLRSSRSSKAS